MLADIATMSHSAVDFVHLTPTAAVTQAAPAVLAAINEMLPPPLAA